MSNFNFIAPVYDGLVRLVFGKKLWEAQKTHLHLIKPNDHVLIIGGGSGRILEWLPNCEVTYVEQSAEMLKHAKQRGVANFQKTDFLTWESDQTFDWVVCPFFLDCFPPSELTKCVQKLGDILGKGKLVVVDFVPAKNNWQAILLKVMHVFFRLFSGLKSKKLLDIHALLIENGFLEIEYSNDGMTFSAVYCR